jgi:cell division septation protein DedD
MITMTDQNDNEFGFEEAGFSEEEFTIEEPAPSEEPEVELTEEPIDEFEVVAEDEGEPEEEARKSSMTRILLPVLLLLVAGGAYFFLVSEEPEPSRVPVQTAKQPIALPTKPPIKPAPAKPVVAEVPVPVTPAKLSDVPAKPVEQAAEAPQLPKTPALVAEKAAATEKTTSEATPSVTETQPAEVSPHGAYSVQVGAYLLQSNLQDAEKKAARTGYPSLVKEARKVTSMTRLLYGRFTPTEADAKLAELKQQSPGAFKIVEGDQVAVYAGSYSNLDKARRSADLFFEKGLSLEEVAVEVPIPLYILKLGPFTDRAAAEKAVRDAKAVGLPTQVVKKPVQ